MPRAKSVKVVLEAIIEEAASIAYMFSTSPKTAFTRKRKLPFATLALTVIGIPVAALVKTSCAVSIATRTQCRLRPR